MSCGYLLNESCIYFTNIVRILTDLLAVLFTAIKREPFKKLTELFVLILIVMDYNKMFDVIFKISFAPFSLVYRNLQIILSLRPIHLQ